MGCKQSKNEVSNRIKIQPKLDLIELENTTIRTPIFSFNGYETIAKCVKCYDADSIHVVFLYNKKFYRFICRLNGIDAAEIRSKNENEKKIAIKGKEFLESLILNKCIKVLCYNYDKYGRILVDIFSNNVYINNLLIKKKYAYKYDGKTKKNFDEWYQKK